MQLVRQIISKNHTWRSRSLDIHACQQQCLAPLFTSQAEAFAQGKKEADADA